MEDTEPQRVRATKRREPGRAANIQVTPASPGTSDTLRTEGDEFPLRCPACTDHLWGQSSEECDSVIFPTILFPCGHTLCGLCAEAVTMAETPCPVCQTTVSGSAANMALREQWRESTPQATGPPASKEAAAITKTVSSLGMLDLSQCHSHPSEPVAFVDINTDELLCAHCEGSSSGPQRELVPIDLSGMDLLDELLNHLPELADGVGMMRDVLERVLAAKAELQTCTETAAAATRRGFDTLRQVLASREAAILSEIDTASKARSKILDAQADELAVSIAQVGHAVRIGTTAIADSDRSALPVVGTMDLARAAEFVSRAKSLLRLPIHVKVSAVMDVCMDVAAVEQMLRRGCRLVTEDPVLRCSTVCQDFVARLPTSATHSTIRALIGDCEPWLAHPAVGTVFCWAIAAAHTDEENDHDCCCADTAVFKALAKTMPAPNDAPVHLCVQWCRAIVAVDPKEAPSTWFLENGGVEIVLGIARAWSSSALVQRHACIALKSLIKGSPLSAEAFEIAIAALGKHVEDAGVAEYACDLLRKLLENPAPTVACGGPCTVDAAATELIIKAMRIHANSEVVQVACAQLVHGLLRGCVSSEKAVMVLEAGGLKTLLAALVAHPRSAAVNTNVSKAVKWLIKTLPSKKPVLELGVLKRLETALRLVIRKETCVAIGTLTGETPMAVFTRLGAPVLFTQLASDNPAEVYMAMDALRSLAVHKAVCGVLIMGFQPTICKAMGTFSGNVCVQGLGCDVLGTLAWECKTAEYHHVRFSLSDLMAVKAAMEARPTSSYVQRMCCEYFAAVGRDAERRSNALVLLGSGCLELMFRSVTTIKTPRMVRVAYCNIGRLCVHRPWAQAALHSCAFDTMLGVAEKTVTHEGAMMMAARAFREMMCRNPKGDRARSRVIRAAELIMCAWETHASTAYTRVVRQLVSALTFFCRFHFVRQVLELKGITHKVTAVMTAAASFPEVAELYAELVETLDGVDDYASSEDEADEAAENRACHCAACFTPPSSDDEFEEVQDTENEGSTSGSEDNESSSSEEEEDLPDALNHS